MVSFNRVVLAGNMTRDPEMRYTQNEVPVCGFGLAVNRVRSKNEEVDFFDVTAWRGLAETLVNYKQKGDPILIEGRLQFRQWQDKEGNNRSKVDVVADEVQFLNKSGGQEDQSGRGSGGSGGGANASSQGSQGGNGGVDFNEQDFDDIPF